MAKNKVKISKVEINIGGKTLELSLKEAEELREILNETFGKTTVVNSPTIIYEPVRPTWPYRTWTISTNNTDGASWSSVNTNLAMNMNDFGSTLSLTASGAG